MVNKFNRVKPWEKRFPINNSGLMPDDDDDDRRK
jgi:hypothetical protein